MQHEAELVERMRSSLSEFEGIREVKMFGGLAFMLDDRMVACVSRDGGLLVRVAPERDTELVARPGARRAEMGTGRSMGTGWITVDLEHLDAHVALQFWIDACLSFHAEGSNKPEKK